MCDDIDSHRYGMHQRACTIMKDKPKIMNSLNNPPPSMPLSRLPSAATNLGANAAKAKQYHYDSASTSLHQALHCARHNEPQQKKNVRCAPARITLSVRASRAFHPPRHKAPTHDHSEQDTRSIANAHDSWNRTHSIDTCSLGIVAKHDGFTEMQKPRMPSTSWKAMLGHPHA